MFKLLELYYWKFMRLWWLAIRNTMVAGVRPEMFLWLLVIMAFFLTYR